MTDNNTPKARRARITAAAMARTPVDHNGKPIGPPAQFHYDTDGLLISIDPAAADES